MSRAARKPPAERRADLSAAAGVLAVEDGLAAVTLRAVAARAGVAPALVAHYWPSMEALVTATFSEVVSAEVAEVRAILARHPEPAARLSALVATLLDGTRDAVTAVWVEAWMLGRRNDALAAAVRGQMDAWQDLIEEVIAAGVARGVFRTGDPGAVAWHLLGTIDGLNAQAFLRWGATTDRTALLARALEGMLGLPPGALATPGS
ncbi:TetR family transcriptional regulator [Leifsonia xyli subsp. xyli]|uniref:Transcriptional regulator, TetR family n=2 Tax=Leifsonia xyli subsp. xyli TaxID=59736 RepID=Q6ACL4_LEIXX|nr:TetR family transcriptional regulator C-terminal domain-containing protein [Leifsonia xyli]AAT89879.1 transcriptional regulator, TetR family [Leifsonia xyli subsp. xyli str. CTCB07]ODA89598.1 TetR family transcriptional regulator [Leifsonia xyli subsp. xyli]